MRNRITYGGRTFNTVDIKNVNMRIAASLLSTRLEANTITATVKCTDPSIANFTRNAVLRYYHRDRQRFLAYLQSVERMGPELYKLCGTSAIGLLMERPHTGGIYTGQTAEAVIRQICGSIPFQIKGTLGAVKLYGWLPYCKPPERSARDNLVQALFAIGGTVKTDLDGVLRIVPLWDGLSGVVDRDDIYTGAGAEYGGKVSSVSVTEHQYSVGGDEVTLFEGEAVSGDVITFAEPVYGLTASGFSIQASNANFARLSTGTGTLKGRKYIHNTREITKTVHAGAEENVKAITDATLVSLTNSNAAAERMAAYYRCLETISCGAVVTSQTAGEVVGAYHPYDKVIKSACIESMDVTASSIMKAQLRELVGFDPPQPESTVTYDHHLVVIASQTVTLPDNVSGVRAVLIGGGTGGYAGGKGNDGAAGNGCSSSSAVGSTTVNTSKGAPGRGGPGGSGGSGGGGGRIATFNINGAVKTIRVNIGGGGSGGSSNGAAGRSGGSTTITVNGTTYSSASGAPSPSGYQDIVTGIIYANTGGRGSNGASGGMGGTPEGTPDDYATAFRGLTGSSAGPNKGGTGGNGGYYGSGNKVARTTGGGGGGGAAYNGAGGNGGTGDGSAGGTGGTGATGTRPTSATHPGRGGTGGNGGGGGGGGGGTFVGTMNGGSTSAMGGSAGSGGNGGPGGTGAPGCVILYYGVVEKVPSGSPLDKNKKLILDKFGRTLVT